MNPATESERVEAITRWVLCSMGAGTTLDPICQTKLTRTAKRRRALSFALASIIACRCSNGTRSSGCLRTIDSVPRLILGSNVLFFASAWTNDSPDSISHQEHGHNRYKIKAMHDTDPRRLRSTLTQEKTGGVLICYLL